MKLENFNDLHPELKVISPVMYLDDRGYFMETYKEIDIPYNFVYEFESNSKEGVIRGMHWQTEPYAQDKLIRVVKGSIVDVVVDIRPDSKTYLKHYTILIDDQNKRQFLIPKGFAHGFLSLKDDTTIIYKCTNIYSPNHQRVVCPFSSQFNINWKKLWYDYNDATKGNILFEGIDIDSLKNPNFILSDRDRNAPLSID